MSKGTLLDENPADVLIAISILAKLLAHKLQAKKGAALHGRHDRKNR